MRLQFKHQKFQAERGKGRSGCLRRAALPHAHLHEDRGINYQQNLTDDEDYTGWRNEPIVPELTDKIILERLNKIQRINQIEPSEEVGAVGILQV